MASLDIEEKFRKIIRTNEVGKKEIILDEITGIGIIKISLDNFKDILVSHSVEDLTYKELSTKLSEESGFLEYIEKWKEQGILD